MPPVKEPISPGAAQNGLCGTRSQFHQACPDPVIRRPDHQAVCRRVQEAADRVLPSRLKRPSSSSSRNRMKLDQIFSSFDRTPVAAASIAQVFQGSSLTAVMSSSRFSARISATDRDRYRHLMYAANLLEKYLPESKFFNPTGIVEEFSRTVRKELDFVEEPRNCIRFRRNLSILPMFISYDFRGSHY